MGNRFCLTPLLILWLMTAPVSAEDFIPYTFETDCTLPGKANGLDILPDGRILVLAGNDLFSESAPGTCEFKAVGSVKGLETGSYGPAFFRISPDGRYFAIGNNKGRIGIFNFKSLEGRWFSLPHFDAAWAGNSLLAVTAGKFGGYAQVYLLNVNSSIQAPEISTLISGIGGASAGIAFDGKGNLYTGNGFESLGPSHTGTIKRFSSTAWHRAWKNATPLNFEKEGTFIVDILSAGFLGFDASGNLHVGGSDKFGEGLDVNFAALIRKSALERAVKEGIPVEIHDPEALFRMDPDTQNAVSEYRLIANPLTRELILWTGSTAYVYRPGQKKGLIEPRATGDLPDKQDRTRKPGNSPDNPGRTLRILTWNLSGNFISNAGLDKAFERILSHLSPDVMVFQEFTAPMGNKLAQRLEKILGRTWHLFGGMKSGIYQNMIASRYPLSMTAEDTLPPSGIRGVTTALIDLPDSRFTKDIYLMGIHLQCCDSPEFNKERQRSADALISRIRDIKTAGGHIDLPVNTPVVILGDFNFTGSPGPELTIQSGKISDEDLFGPSIRPDWDGSNLTDLAPGDRVSGNIHTWPSSTGKPHIRYDRIFYTDAVVVGAKGRVLNTLTLSREELEKTGLKKEDTQMTSDHLPLVMDLVLP
ncbi:endonuclease/exonuclease/phosphatase family protein [Desulfospira joergensenii]|uniref:endonuclease/exonuclease/phosphatase family protein n=1 Tax=Desulfospira joergensenii TaxID=53329 RepID=UPI0013775039|nr:endonuclease/exonuclease/phosphatase family protein [Desulfospira joergensenii]